MICQDSNKGFKYVIKFKLNQKYIFNNDVFLRYRQGTSGDR